LFLTDDRFSIAVMDACREEGLRIPKDVALISSVLTPEMADACGVTLTHPVQDGSWLVGPACERLESLMSNPRQPLQTIVIPCPGVVQGESTETFAIDDPLVARAVDFIDSRYRDRINVADVISHLECSRRAVERRFVTQMKITMHDYIIRKRVALAKSYMKDSPELKLDQIAISCGFGDRRSFRLAFLSLTGITPDSWRGQSEPQRG
jgi:LacI family transcriptional regulator